MADKNKGGRSKLFKSADELHKKIEEYFAWCDSHSKLTVTDKGVYKEFKPYTISGLCLYIDMTRDTLSQYEKQEQFSDTIKKAKQRIENWVEENSLIGNINPTTSIFNLKNNFGWKDRQEIDAKTVNTNINTDISDLPPEALEEITNARGQEEVMRIVSRYKK